MIGSDKIKKMLSPMLYATGRFEKRWRVAADAPVTVVLCYHRVTPDDVPTEGLFDMEYGIQASVFKAQMQFMLKHFEPLRPSQVLQPSASRLRFAVTFDDGYEDNFCVAAPILESLGISAAFYVVSDFVESDSLFWWEQLALVLRQAQRPRAQPTQELSEILGPHFERDEIDVSTWPLREAAFRRFSFACRNSSRENVPRIIGILADVLETPLVRSGRHYPLMSWKQMDELSDRGFEIGCHTRTHPNVTDLDDSELHDEITGALDLLQKNLRNPVTTFAYPYGYVDDAAACAVKGTGIELAFGGGTGGVISAQSNPFRLPRIQLVRKQHFACAYRVQRAFDATY